MFVECEQGFSFFLFSPRQIEMSCRCERVIEIRNSDSDPIPTPWPGARQENGEEYYIK